MTIPCQEKTALSVGIQCRELTLKRSGGGHGQVTILNRITAGFEAGRIALVTGETGAGKSTLMHVLAGLQRPTSGEVLTDEGAVSRFTAAHRDRWRRQVGIVFQDLQLVSDLSVLENILLPAIPRRSPWSVLMQAAQAMLSQMDLMAFGRRRVDRLSGGQRQRVAVARAMMSCPKYLFLDEPTAFQDDRHTQELLNVWDGLARQGTCVVICSHDLRLRQASHIHQALVLADGCLERPS